MSRKTISAALLAAATFGALGLSTAHAQSYGQDGSYRQTPEQQYDSQAPQYYNDQGDQTTSPTYYQGSQNSQGYNGQYVDRHSNDMRSGPNNYARDMKDGPMGTSPGS